MERFRVSPFNSLLVTFGITIILEALIQWIWTADYRRLETPYGDLKLRLGGIYLPLPEMITLAISVAVAAGVWLSCDARDLGRAIRARRRMRRSPSPSASTEGAGACASRGSAGAGRVAGVCIALTFTLAPAQIFAWIGVVFAVVMLGGLGRRWGRSLPARDRHRRGGDDGDRCRPSGRRSCRSRC